MCYFKAFGKADEGVPMATDSIFRLASMSKVVAAACVMQLFEQGRIALHEPISTYLPEFADPKVAVVKDWQVTQLVTAEREITVHDLLTMTAGMTNTWWHRVFEPSVYGVVPQLYKDAGVVDDMSAPATTLEENIKKLAQMPLIAHPGTMFDYSNNSVDTLCRLVEVVSGLDFDTYQRRYVLDPLQMHETWMHETWFFTPDDQQHRIAAVYEAGRDEKVTEARPLGLGSRVQPAPHLLQRARRPARHDGGLLPIRPDAALWRRARRGPGAQPDVGAVDDHQPDRRPLQLAADAEQVGLHGCGPVGRISGAVVKARLGPSRARDGTVLLLDVLPHDRQRRAADRSGEIRPGPQPLRAPVVLAQVGDLLAQPAGGDTLRAVHQHDLLHPREVSVPNYAVSVLRHEHHMRLQRERAVPTGTQAVLVGPRPYGARVQLRYAYRLNPTPGQCQALARAFGCARVVFNDAVAARRTAREAGQPFPTDAALSKALTAVKRTPARAWLAEVSAVVLQQALADANTAYRNFFASLKGTRKGRRLGRRGSGPAGTGRSRSGSPRRPGSGSPARAGCGCPGSGTCRCAGPGRCRPSRHR